MGPGFPEIAALAVIAAVALLASADAIRNRLTPEHKLKPQFQNAEHRDTENRLEVVE